MTDQGNGSDGGNGEGGGTPDWNQPNYGQQPGPDGQYGPPSGNGPQYPNEQFPGQGNGPQYPTEQFPGQQYGPPNPTEQFPAQGYGPQQPGQPYPGQQYPGQQPTGQYDPQFNPYSGAAPANPGKSQKGILIGLGAVVAAGVVVLVLALTGVFSSDDTKTDSPRDAAERVLLASKNQDLNAVKASLCKKDLGVSDIADIVGEDRATDYTITSVDQQGSERAIVKAKITTKDGTNEEKIPVIREDGAWKVCFSEPSFGSSSGSAAVASPSFSIPRPSFSIPSLTVPSISLPSLSIPSVALPSFSTGSFCASTINPASTARLFVSAITIKSLDLAAGCVYENRVSRSQLEALTGSGKVYAPTIDASDQGPTFTFKSVTGSSTLRITIEKQSDGKYYVISAEDS